MGLFDLLLGSSSGSGSSAPFGESSLQAVGRGQILPARERAVLEVRRYACSCSIIVNGKGNGTGFLVGKDLVITNYHVVVDGNGRLRDPATIHCRFGFYEAGEYGDGRHAWIPLLADPVSAFPASSPTAPGDRTVSPEYCDYRDNVTGLELYDYAILRLADCVGEKPGKGPLDEMNPLGWIAIDPDYPLPAYGQPLTVIEFPERVGAGPRGFQQDASSFSEGKLVTLIAGGLRVCHDAATRKGASGSGIFDSRSWLIGLHNAGKELADKTADNRFVPISRILKDIKRQNPEVFREIIGSTPPPLTIFGLSKRTREAVQARVDAAKIFLDRDREHGSIIAALGAGSVKPVQVNHVVCNHALDGIEYFVQRLTISAAHLESRRVAEVTAEFLRGQAGKPSSFVPWAESSLTWPEPKTPVEQAEADLMGQLDSQIVGPRTLLAIYVDDVDQRDPAEELEYMRLLGEVLSGYSLGNDAAKPPRQMLQAVVVYRLFPEFPVDLARFAPLWTALTAPQNCGVSVALPKVQRNDVQPWVTLLNSAWSPPERIVVPDTFKPRVRLNMKEVLGLFEGTIAEAAIALVEKNFKDKQ